MEIRIITGVAIRSVHDGKVYSLGRPHRHHHVIKMLAGLGFPIPVKGEQGFVLQDGETFVDRFTAMSIVKKNHQLNHNIMSGRDYLMSEDLW